MAKIKRKKAKKANPIYKNITFVLAIFIIVLSPFAFFYIYFLDRFYPNVYIENINVSGKSPKEAQSLINPQVNIPEKLALKYNGKTFYIQTSILNASFNKERTINRAYQLGRTGNILFDISQIISSLKSKTVFPLELTINEEALNDSITKIANEININPTNAKFTINGNKVTSFSPESNGLRVESEELIQKIKDEIAKNDSRNISIDIPTQIVYAQIKTSDVNNLGIKELIGSGTSHFAGSPSSRIYNINLAASRINGTLIAPGDTFSFNETVGDISSLNGYQQAFVIQNGQTVLGDGGGVCQVSTTMFRAAMNAGLPIIERHAHAYRVHYYEEDAAPGFDATIYSPQVDFKFRNDTNNFILIQTQIDLTKLVLTFNFYGTKDERVVNITNPT